MWFRTQFWFFVSSVDATDLKSIKMFSVSMRGNNRRHNICKPVGSKIDIRGSVYVPLFYFMSCVVVYSA